MKKSKISIFLESLPADIQDRLAAETAKIHQQRIAAERLQSALADPTNDLLHAISKLEWVLSQVSIAKYASDEIRSAIALIKPHAIDPKDPQ